MRISALFSAAMVLLLDVIPASAAMITLGGDFPLAPFGAIGPLAPGGMLVQPIPLQGAGNHSLSGTVIASDFGGTAISLTLTDLVYRSDGTGTGTETIHLQQSFTVVPGNFMAQHAFSGFADFHLDTQSAGITKISTHNAVTLPRLDDFAFGLNDPVTLPLADGPTLPQIVPSGAVYTVDTTYTLDLSGGMGGGDWVQIRLPSSGEDDSALPEPSGLLLLGSGLFLLGCFQGLKLVRTRQDGA
jgi:hypothetical protein